MPPRPIQSLVLSSLMRISGLAFDLINAETIAVLFTAKATRSIDLPLAIPGNTIAVVLPDRVDRVIRDRFKAISDVGRGICGDSR